MLYRLISSCLNVLTNFLINICVIGSVSVGNLDINNDKSVADFVLAENGDMNDFAA